MERTRLIEAWERILEFKSNADAQLRLSNTIHYTIMIASLLTSLLSVAYEQVTHCDEDGFCLPPRWLAVFKWSVSLLPLLSAFLLSCDSRFSPHTKWAELAIAASAVETEVYQYRTRVNEYAPQLKKHALLEEGPSGKQNGKSAGSKQETAKKRRGAGAEASVTRRGTFSKNLEEVHNRLMNGDMTGGSLTPLRPDAFWEFQRKLMNQPGQAHQEDSASEPLL
ncbi:unnamed protein product [Polarella glacialis]|uniref:Uncharacterized protein n=1 Tax=Polarella glacialis TaxID=89957 RepID=A0A813H9D0_POLGL|nr:unnamed protein product [Polarella glacialis]